MKKIISLVLLLTMFCTMGTSALANNTASDDIIVIELDSYYDVPLGNLAPNTIYVFPTDTAPESDIASTNINTLITTPPVDNKIVPFGSSIPTDTWDVSTSGRYDYKGTSNSETLYTNYRFTGSGTYTVYVDNKKAGSQTVVCYRASDGYKLSTFTVSANSTFTHALSTSNVWYLGFTGTNMNVSGYVEK